MKKSLSLLLFLAVSLAACGTVQTRKSDFQSTLPRNASMPRIYSGFWFDLNMLDPSTPIGADPDAEGADASVLYKNFIYVFDLPFSLVADTLLLPWTIYEQARYGAFSEEESLKQPK